jgi:hypothetical protein
MVARFDWIIRRSQRGRHYYQHYPKLSQVCHNFTDTGLHLLTMIASVAIFICIMASLPSIYQKKYGFNDLQIGLCFMYVQTFCDITSKVDN